MRAMPYALTLAVLLCLLAVPCRAGFEEGVAAYRSRDFARAMKEFLPLARKGNADAQFLVGLMHRNGEGVPPNVQEAVKWYRKAADQGQPAALTNLGTLYIKGEGVKEDVAKGAGLVLEGARGGDVVAMCKIGLFYLAGLGVAKSDKDARDWLTRAAEAGDGDCQLLVGQLAASGTGPIPKDPVRGYALLLLAEEQHVQGAAKLRSELAKTLSLEDVRRAEELARGMGR